MKLRHASEAAQTAAFNVVYWDLAALIKQLPGLAQGPASKELNSADGRTRILKVLNDAFDEAERVEAAAAEAKK